jgi:hypothetical protein
MTSPYRKRCELRSCDRCEPAIAEPAAELAGFGEVGARGLEPAEPQLQQPSRQGCPRRERFVLLVETIERCLCGLDRPIEVIDDWPDP